MYMHVLCVVYYAKVGGACSNVCQSSCSMKDLAENGIEVELMHLGKDFSVSKFYQVKLYM